MANGLKALGSYLADDTLSDEALDFVADPYADRVTRIQRSGQSSPELQAFLARTDATQEQRDAERAVEAASRLPQVKAREDMLQEGVPPLLRRTEGMEPRVSSVSAPSNLGLNSFLRQLAASRPSSEAQPSRQPRGSDLGVFPVPPPEGVSADLSGPFFRPVNESNLPPKGIRVAVEPSPTMAVAAPRAGPPTPKPASVASPIPVASAPVEADVPDVVAGTIPPTTPTQSAPPAGGQAEPDLNLIPTEDLRAATTEDGASPNVRAEMARRLMGAAASTPSVPASDGSGGDDEMGRLSMGQALVRALEGSGSVISGQNLRSGAADTLGERMKQIEALRAKKAEKAEEQTGFKTANLGFLGGYRDVLAGRDDLLPGFKALEEAASVMPPDKFAKAVRDWSMTPSTIRGKEAGIAKTEAQTKTEEVKPEVARGGLEVKQKTLVERERSNKANEDIRGRALLVKRASDTKANNDVRAAGSDPKQAEKAITDAMKSAEKKDLGIVSNIRDFQGLEAVAPGFTQGKVPSWLGQGSIAAAIKVPGLNKQATQLASALELFTAGIRNSLFGASLTGNEKESFDAIVSSGLLMPPDVLAANINRIRQGAARFAQNHFTVAQELHPEVTGRVLGASTIFGPATRKGGVYADVWTLPEAPAAGGGGANRPPKPTDKSGMKTLWNKKTGQWVRYTPEQEAKARAADAIED